ncbi:MAG: MGMT family protein [Candidatus Diapherotrites archaeon]|nr:MGMT family protein [Candidatus Diapherotrites archaeon]
MRFSEKVLELTRQIPKGKITTYQELAKALGNPMACRAIGNALNKNNQPITIPCHRVVKKTGKIGGYSARQRKKTTLLKKEGLRIKNNRIIDLPRYLHKFK